MPGLNFTRLLAGLLLAGMGIARADVVPRAPQAAPPVRYGADALSRIVHSKILRCGLITAAEDYSMASTHGDVSAFGADLCRASAAALLGDPARVVLTGMPDDVHGLRALHEQRIDVLFGVTPDAANALPYSIAFAPTMLFDGQGFLVNRASHITSPEQLAGKLLCFITGTSQEARMNSWGALHHVTFYAHDFQERGEMDAALVGGSCDAITDDVTALAQIRSRFHGRIADFAILPQLIAIDPWAPAVVAGEARLTAVLTDVFAALIEAESQDITAANVSAPHPGAATLLGPTPGIAQTLAMPNLWATRAISAGGNYAEIFARDLGSASPYKLSRGASAGWQQGGMLAAPTLR